MSEIRTNKFQGSKDDEKKGPIPMDCPHFLDEDYQFGE